MDTSTLFRWCAWTGNKLNICFMNGVWAEYDIAADTIREMGKVSGLNIKKLISGETCVFENKIFIIDSRGKEIFIFDKEFSELHSLTVNVGDEAYANYHGFCIADKILYLFPKNGGNYIAVDCLTEEFSYVPCEDLYGLLDCQKDTTYVFKEDTIYFLQRNSCDLIRFNLANKKAESIRLVAEAKPWRHIVWKEDGLYLLTGFGELYKWQDELRLVNDKITKLPLRYIRLVGTENKIYILPASENHIYYYDVSGHKLCECKDYPMDYEYIRDREWLDNYAKYMENVENEDYICFLNRVSNYTLFIDKKEEKLFWRKIRCNDIIQRDFLWSNEGTYYVEKKDKSLKEFLQYIIRRNG